MSIDEIINKTVSEIKQLYEKNMGIDAIIIPITILYGIKVIMVYGEKMKLVGVKSLTPDEMETYLIDLYESHMKDFYIMISVLNGNTDRFGGVDKVKEVFMSYVRKYVREECERTSPNAIDTCIDMSMKSYEERFNDVVEKPTLESMHRYYDIVLGLLDRYIKPPASLLFIGPPGIGKSETVKRVAMKLANRYGLTFIDYKGTKEEFDEIMDAPWSYFVFIDFRLSSVEPADLTGIPFHTEGYVEYKPFMWAKILTRVPSLLFLDEFTNIQRTDVLSASYQLILDRRAGFARFNNAVFVVSAGNPPEHAGSIAIKLPRPLADRFEILNTIPPTVDMWFNYMNRTYGDEWIKPIGEVIKAIGDIIFVQKPEVGTEILKPEEKFVTPRSLTKLCVELYKYYKNRGEDPNEYYTKIAEYINNSGGCTNIRSKITTQTNMVEYDAKITCEKFYGKIGSNYSELILMLSAIPLEKSLDEEAEMSFEELYSYYNNIVDKMLSKIKT